MFNENNNGWDMSYDEAQDKYGVQKEAQNQYEYMRIWAEATEKSMAKREYEEEKQREYDYMR